MERWIMKKKAIKYRKIAHGDYRVYVNGKEYRYGDSYSAKKVYRSHLKKGVK